VVNVQAERALLELFADELRGGLGRAAGLDPQVRFELLGLVDDLVELATGLEARPLLDGATPFDVVYGEVQR
jgi:hypothetical protein